MRKIIAAIGICVVLLILGVAPVRESLKKRFFKPRDFIATFYIANPIELVSAEIKTAIGETEKPFNTRKDVWVWLKEIKAPPSWKGELKNALRETSPWNLWRTARGLKPFTKSGKSLKPLIIHHGKNNFEIKETGDIATDPSVIPTGSEMTLYLPFRGEEYEIKAKAADIGGGVKGRHIDIPIYVKPSAKALYEDNNSPALKRITVSIW